MGWKRVICVWGFVFGVPGLLWAQSPAGAISGKVEDASRAAVPSVRIELGEVDTGVTHTASSDEDGQFEFRGLPQGHYRIRAVYPGFEPSEQQEVLLSAGRAVALTLTMEVEQVRQSVTVTADAAPLDLTTPHSSLLVTEDVMAAMPVSGRSLEQLALLAPGMHTVAARIPARSTASRER